MVVALALEDMGGELDALACDVADTDADALGEGVLEALTLGEDCSVLDPVGSGLDDDDTDEVGDSESSGDAVGVW